MNFTLFRFSGGRSGRNVADVIPLKRLGSRLEMAHAVLFLVAETGSYITGETLVADGAAWLSTPNSMELAAMRMRQVQSKV